MQKEEQNLWEDDEFVYISEELFKHLPKKYREALEVRKQQGEDVLRLVDRDLQSLIKLMNAMPTTSSLSYMLHRLRKTKFEATIEYFMEQEMLTTAFIVTYARLFASGRGVAGMSRDNLPIHLRPVHDEIIQLRNKRYAHNDGHESVESGIEVRFDSDVFQIGTEINLGFYVGGKNEWEELVTFIDALMHERLTRILSRLKEKTGCEWTIPSGPAPDWVGDYG